MNVARWLLRSALQAPVRAAVHAGTKPYATWREFASRSGALAWTLRNRLGLDPGDRVALVMKNRPEYLECLFGAWWAGLVAVPINAKLHAREVAFILQDCGAKAVFIAPEWEADIGAAVNAATSPPAVFSVASREFGQWCRGESLPLVDVEPEALAWLFYTSGTTGRPKGARLSHRNLAAMTFNYFTDVDAISPADAIVHAAPLSHGSGLYSLAHVLAGAAQVIPESGGFDPSEIHELLGHHAGVTMFAAPTMVKRLCADAPWREARIANLKTIVYGGGPMYVADIQEALRRFGQRFVQIYGQGESPMTITALSKHHLGDATHPRHLERIASVGLPHSGVRVLACDPDGHAVPTGEIGEVCVKGDTVMAGYWNDPEATGRSLREGWLRTGDLGCFDGDGFLTLKDRSKDLIISGGSNIYPREVEEVLLAHPAVGEAAVVGRPDAQWGETVVAFIVPRGAAPEAAELDRHCLAHIARFKRPKEYRFVRELPKNHYGKVLKTELRKALG